MQLLCMQQLHEIWDKNTDGIDPQATPVWHCQWSTRVDLPYQVGSVWAIQRIVPTYVSLCWSLTVDVGCRVYVLPVCTACPKTIQLEW